MIKGYRNLQVLDLQYAFLSVSSCKTLKENVYIVTRSVQRTYGDSADTIKYISF